MIITFHSTCIILNLLLSFSFLFFGLGFSCDWVPINREIAQARQFAHLVLDFTQSVHIVPLGVAIPDVIRHEFVVEVAVLFA